MNKNLSKIIILLLLFESQCSFTQEDSPEYPKNCFTLNLLAVISEVRIGYERAISDRQILRLAAGIKYPLSPGPYKADGSSFISIDKTFLYTKGYHVEAGYAYFIIPAKGLYLSPSLYHYYQFYRDLYYEYCTGMTHESYVKQQSIDRRVSGLRFLIGKKLALSSKHKSRWWALDFFAGISINYQQEEVSVSKKKYDTCNAADEGHDFYIYDPPLVEKSYKSGVGLLNLGITIGYCF